LPAIDPSLGTEISFVRFLAAAATCHVMALFLSPLGRLFFGGTMNQPLRETRPVTQGSLGAFIGLCALLAINLLGIGNLFFGWW
jgi:hypothetical protein